MLYALYSDSATVMSSPFAFDVPGKGVGQKPLSGSDFLPPSAASNQLPVGAGLMKGGNHLKPGLKSTQMFAYTRDAVVYVQFLGTYRRVSGVSKTTDLQETSN